MTIATDGVDILLRGVNETTFAAIREINLMTYDRKNKCLRAPISIDLLERLKALFGYLPAVYDGMLSEMQRTREATDFERNNPDPVPLVHYPVKADLFKHQIRAANMALIHFGFGGDVNARTE